ncbi:MAG: histidinol-phosphate transaminase [Oligoflexia bacterium]|nr:histidinol-phosphate transaminase [Oligoflexia bacterium]
MTDIYKLARKNIVDMKAYSSARSIVTKADVFMDANENPLEPELDILGDTCINRYPEPQPEEIKKGISSLYKTKIENIFMGRGSDDAIDALVRVFCEAGRDSIAICPPTYGMYEIAAQIQGAETIKIPSTADFDIKPENILKNINNNTKLVFLCSPNNPTGNLLNRNSILELCKKLENRALVIVDEAYIEFAGNTSSLVDYTESNVNLVVMRTFSKAFSLAGARFGVAIANRDVVSLLNKVRAPYPISTPSIIVIKKMLEYIMSDEGSKAVKNRIKTIIKNRNSLMEKTGKLPFVEKVFRTDANFFVIKVDDAKGLVAFCREQGIIIRDRSNEPGLENCVRITTGTEEENNKLIKCFAKWSKK